MKANLDQASYPTVHDQASYTSTADVRVSPEIMGESDRSLNVYYVTSISRVLDSTSTLVVV